MEAKDFHSSHPIQLKKEHERFILLDNMLEMVCVFQLHGKMEYVNAKWVECLGYSEDEAKEQSFWMYLNKNELRKWEKMEKRLEQGIEYSHALFSLKTKKEGLINVIGSMNPAHSEAGKPRVIGVFQNATAFFKAQPEWERFFLFAIDLLCMVDMKGRIKKTTTAFETMLKHSDDDLVGRSFMEYVHPDDWEKTKNEYSKMVYGKPVIFENRFRGKDGVYKWLSWTAYPYPDEDVVYAFVRDVTPERQARDQLEKMALNDDLTGLLNRRGFNLFARQLYQIALREKRQFLLILADLNGLKTVNDQYGHAEGDAVLIRSARILKGRFRASDVVARIGGDEFAIALIIDEGKMPKRIRDELADLVTDTRTQYSLPYDPPSFSIGMASADVNQRLPLRDLLQEADEKMYQEKLKRQPHSSA